uniref:Uncharacterized protein n=1 Tax=Meloidogyne enterolobii TaxID=390850 RepID=A0A6V7X5X4_MELEN|nr:unnamed protein product [Meloidogyne enterolobii]
MEKRPSFKEMLLNHKLNYQEDYLAYGRILKSIFGSKLYFVLGMKYTELFMNTDNNFDFFEFYNEYFKSNIVGKWRIKTIIEYFIYKEWFDHFEQANKLNNNFVAIWNKIFSNYWMGENYLQKYFAYFNNSEYEDDIDKNDIFEFYLYAEEYTKAKISSLTYLNAAKYCTEIGLKFISNFNYHNYKKYLNRMNEIKDKIEYNNDNFISFFILVFNLNWKKKEITLIKR